VDAVITAASAAGWLLLILYFPSGLAALIAPVRERVIRGLVRLAGHSPDALLEEIEPSTASPQPAIATAAAVESANGRDHVIQAIPRVLLGVDGLSKSYGGVRAVKDVTFEVQQGSTVGLIGPNGAGKTTLFELIAGFVRPDAGTVWFDGDTISRPLALHPRFRLQLNRSAEYRGRRGLVRSFQDAALFPTMSVLEVVMLAFERVLPTTLIGAVAGSQERERAKRDKAAELIRSTGLQPYIHKQVQELSTGTRRIVEIACLIALEPRLLLLDEPSSGIAQRETEALGELIVDVKERLDCTVMVIEHDIPLVMSISDRIIAMESGRIICDGSPAEVRADARVVESYLGGDVRAIARSGAAIS
jgi:ABC-type branched-subunit amino acid transport system ATPase component